jgi:NlpC/P60 family putative phage cell wall peptidase
MATDSTRIVSIAREWIGTPYVHQASLKGKGCDCIGLLRGVWRELQATTADPEILPPYSPDWAEATGRETLYEGLKRHLTEIAPADIAAGSVVLFRMIPNGPAKHCGIAAELDGVFTLIHSRMNKQVNEEPFDAYWRRKLAFVFEVP